MNDHWPNPHIQEVAHLNQTIALLQQRLTEQEQETRHWLDTVKRQLAAISAARGLINAPHCTRPYMSDGHEDCTPAGDGCDLYHWHVLRHALTLLDGDQALAETLTKPSA